MANNDIIMLLEKRNLDYEFPDYAQLRKDVFELEDLARKAHEKLDSARKDFQAKCTHPIILEYQYPHMGRNRQCYICDFRENQPIADPGDEYNYATYGKFETLTGNFYATIKDSWREVYRMNF